MARKYSNSPIVEAVCEFWFIPAQVWDITIPGLLYAKIGDEFQVKQQQIGFGIELGRQPKEEGQVEQKIELAPPRMQFFRSDKTALVQVGPDLLTINHLKPYPAWEILKPLVIKNLDTYQQIGKPRAFRRIGLRYINKIEFDNPIELTDYFNYYPSIPSDLPQTHESFQIRVEIPYEESRDCLLLTLASAIPEKLDTLSLVLDLDYIMAIPEGILLSEVSDWLEKAHTTVETAFETCITDKCRNLFGEVK